MALTKVDQTMVSDQVFGRRNLIINGDMRVAQRATSAAVSNGTNEGYATLDRWRHGLNNAAVATVSQSTTVPTGEGFANSMKIDVTTADTSVASNDFWVMVTKLEGQDLQRIKKGTSNAEKLTLSFWVRSTKTGVYVVELVDNDNSSRAVSLSYTIASADTWQKVELTFPADTTGVFDNNNEASLEIAWWLVGGSNYTSGTLATTWASQTDANRAVGQVNFFDSTSNEYYITGVQLEVGDKATPFEHLTIGEELALCQRYFVSTAYPNNFQATHGVNGNEMAAYNTDGYWLYQGISYYENGYAHDQFQLPVAMRTRPTPTPYAPNSLVSGYTGGSTKLAAYGMTGGAEWRAADISLYTWAGTPACASFRVDYGSTDEDGTEGMWIGGFEFDAEL